MENKIFNTPQDEILESLTPNDYKNIILPSDDFFDDRSVSSISDSESMNEQNNDKGKKKIRFGHDIYEKYSAYYICETVLKIDSQNIKYVNEVNLNALTVYNRKLSYFDEKLFSMLLDFCKKKK